MGLEPTIACLGKKVFRYSSISLHDPTCLGLYIILPSCRSLYLGVAVVIAVQVLPGNMGNTCTVEGTPLVLILF
jgi:hypothetical protein